MSKAIFRAVVFDIDGTAVPNRMDALPSPRLIAAMTTARQYLQLIPATGRPYVYAERIFLQLGLTGPAITSGGTNVISVGSGEVLSRKTIPAAAFPQILGALESTPYQVILEDEPKDTVRTGGAIRDNLDIIFIENVAEDDVAILLHRLNAVPGILPTTVASWGTGYTFNITALDATKEHAITDVLAQLGIARDETVGVGDGDNDLHLFVAVGYKIAMGNATAQLKAAADEVTSSVEADGLAEIIERLILECARTSIR